jgi:membrane-associated phospholipid phosphatase
MKGFFKDNKVFIILYFAILLIILPYLIIFTKGNIHLYINNLHSISTDFFFKYITNLGSGLAVVFISVLYLFISFRKTSIIAVSGIMSGLIVQILKQVVFNETVRPIKFFEGTSNLHLIDGVDILAYNSFPSGHSATIFALCLCLAAFSKLKLWKIALFCIAILVAFSRIYLSQHFLTDIYVGSIIGVLSAAVAVICINKIKAAWLDNSLPGIYKKAQKG